MTDQPMHDHAPHDADLDAQQYVARARERKLAEAQGIGIDSKYISNFVEHFYARIRSDDLLGPIFAERISDWPTHLVRMKTFWRSVLHNSGEFRGNPMVKHIAIPGLEPRHFAHWLELFYRTLQEAEPDRKATELVAQRARMIAESLLSGIEVHRNGLASRPKTPLPELEPEPANRQLG